MQTRPLGLSLPRVANLGRSAGTVLIPALLASMCWLSACLPRSDKPLERQTDDDAGSPDPIDLDAGTSDDTQELPDVAPHAVVGVSPTHGPFSGGQTVLVRGNGFTSDVRVWFGDEQVPSQDVLPVDPGRVQVTVPPGKPGKVPVATQNGSDSSTRAELMDAYVYDAFYLEPTSGPTSGGTELTLFGSGTQWNDDTQVLIDLVPCDKLEVVSKTEIVCTTPPGTAGSKNVRVTTDDDVSVDVLDAFVYGDSDSTFRGGLGGQPLDDELSVLVLDNFTGSPIPGASVVVGTEIDDAWVERTNSSGLARFSGTLQPHQTVTVAAKCFSPITFVDVPVDTVTAYLDPVLDVSCADFSDIPALPGNSSSSGATVRGELVFPSRAEFERSGWSNVPGTKSDDERQVAYVFRASSSATRDFQLPSSASAVTPTAAGDAGYNFYIGALPGNATYYALAGIENRAVSPPLFTAYAMGVAPGVTTRPDTTTTEVFIPIDVPLDHTLSVEVEPPQTTDRGPDRLEGHAVLRLSEAGYAILPISRQEQLLPGTQRFDFVGVPPLSGSLTGATYVTFADAVTTAGGGLPDSFSGLFSTTNSSQTLRLDNFLEVPLLEQPVEGSRWNGTRLEVSWAPGGEPVDLVVFDITSGGGLITWTVAAPGDVQQIDLPALRELSSDLAPAKGSVSIRVTAAQIRDFDYGSLRYRQLGPSGFDAFARDEFRVSY